MVDHGTEQSGSKQVNKRIAVTVSAAQGMYKMEATVYEANPAIFGGR